MDMFCTLKTLVSMDGKWWMKLYVKKCSCMPKYERLKKKKKLLYKK